MSLRDTLFCALGIIGISTAAFLLALSILAAAGCDDAATPKTPSSSQAPDDGDQKEDDLDRTGEEVGVGDDGDDDAVAGDDDAVAGDDDAVAGDDDAGAGDDDAGAGDDDAVAGDDDAAVGDDDAVAGDDDAGARDDDAAASEDVVIVSGTAKRTIAPASGKDGKGTLCLSVIVGCPNMANQNPKQVDPMSYAEVLGADLSGNAAVPFEIAVPKSAIKSGKKYYVGGFLSEAGGPCTSPQPKKGDIVTFEMVGDASCGKFTYDESDVSGLSVKLGYIMPW